MVKIIFLFLISISLKVISANLDTELQSFLTSSTKKSFASKKTNAVQNLYKSYKNKFNRNFKTDREEKLRFSSFNDTLNAILDNHRQGPKTFTLGFNKFTLWTQDELDKIRNGIQLPQSIINETSMNATNGSLILNKKLLRIKRTVPDSYDLTTMVVPSTNVPYLSSVKNQGACGSCYAFAFITLLEYQCVTQFRINFKLSEQQILDCSTNDRGCSGGHFINTFNYFKNNLWQANGDSYYSYRGDAGECAFKSWVSKVQFASFDYKIIGENDATAMQEALVRYGPLWTSLFVGSQESSMYRIISAKFMSYKSGVFQITGCPKSVFNNNHAVAIVGYGIDADTNTPYWTVRNSWGSDWGDNGYFKIKRGDNMCGIEANVYYMGRNL